MDETKPVKAGRRSALALPWRLLRSGVIGYTLVALIMFLFQRKFQYLPDSSAVSVPTGERFRGLEEVDLVAGGVRLKAWYWPGSGGTTIVLFHGNAGHRGHRLEWMERFHRDGHGLFLLDYRGYGGSEGSPTEAGLFADGAAALAWLEQRGETELIYFGESLGCGVAVEMAVRNPPRALVLHSGYTSLVDVAQRHYFYLPVWLLMKDRYACRAKIARISAPLLMVHGEHDALISPSMGRELFDAASAPKEWFPVPGARHNDVPWVQGYHETVAGFLGRSLDSGAGAR